MEVKNKIYTRIIYIYIYIYNPEDFVNTVIIPDINKIYSDFKRYSKTYRQLGDLEISDDFIKVPLL